MSTRSSFLLLGFFSRSTYANECSLFDMLNFQKQTIEPYKGCLVKSMWAGLNPPCAGCGNEAEKLANTDYSFPIGCTTINGRSIRGNFEPLVADLLATHNSACRTNVKRGGTDTKVDEPTPTGDIKKFEPSGTVDESSDTKVDDKSPASSGAHGYSAAHYMLAIFVPMAVLFL